MKEHAPLLLTNSANMSSIVTPTQIQSQPRVAVSKAKRLVAKGKTGILRGQLLPPLQRQSTN